MKKSNFTVGEVVLLNGEKVTIDEIKNCDDCANAIYYIDSDEDMNMARECDFQKILATENTNNGTTQKWATFGKPKGRK